VKPHIFAFVRNKVLNEGKDFHRKNIDSLNSLAEEVKKKKDYLNTGRTSLPHYMQPRYIESKQISPQND